VCGRSDGRLCESLVGDVVTDAMRARYASIGVQFAITNSGGLRDALTCSGSGAGTGFCPTFTPPPYKITRGQVLALLPFGNQAVTLPVNGAELKQILEVGVSTAVNASTPFGLAANGRFPQISGLCFTYNIEAPSGSRVTGAVFQAGDGSCTGAAVDLTSATTYKIAWNDFNVAGGDGYPNFKARSASQGILAQVVDDYIVAAGTINPVIQGRIHCFDPNPDGPASAGNCTIGSP
jgi:2',3'-cyclic-nucleotide 2'-phosphodiesterase (5'-nucleotidase family)